MPEVLGEAGLYFDPERPEEIALAVRRLLNSPALRAQKAALAFAQAQSYSWASCARATFAFLAQTARLHAQHRSSARPVSA